MRFLPNLYLLENRDNIHYEHDDRVIMFRNQTTQKISSSLLHIPNHRWDLPNLLVNGYRRLFSMSESGPGATLTLHLYLVPKVLMGEDLHLLPHIPSCCVQRQI
jgi:hypothetical protein